MTKRQLPLAVVIGAGAMGMSVARRLARDHEILLCDIAPDHLETCVKQLHAEGHDARSMLCDVTDSAAVSLLGRDVLRCGGFRTLVQVAGLSPSAGDWRAIMRVNLIGPALVERALYPAVRPGSVAIFIASLAGHLVDLTTDVVEILDAPLAGDLVEKIEPRVRAEAATIDAYQFSKAGLMRLCQRRATAWGRGGGRILSLSPGMIATPMGAAEMQAQASKRAMFGASPLAREGRMSEVAEVAGFLASTSASFITGTDILVDGGLAAAVRMSQD